MTIRVHHFEQRNGLSVCKHCGNVENKDRIGPSLCSGRLPPINTRSADPNPTTDEWRVVDSYGTGGGVHDSWRALGPWRSSREEAVRDAGNGAQARVKAMAESMLLDQWRGLRDDASKGPVLFVLGAIELARCIGALDNDGAELWRRRIETCPGHDDEGGRAWCAFCGVLSSTPDSTRETI